MNAIIRGKQVSRRILKQGNSHAITIPPQIMERLSLRAGDPIVITDDGEQMIVRKYRREST
jgi:antitoxin component of MazEF toxin-antitoxin module